MKAYSDMAMDLLQPSVNSANSVKSC